MNFFSKNKEWIIPVGVLLIGAVIMLFVSSGGNNSAVTKAKTANAQQTTVAKTTPVAAPPATTSTTTANTPAAVPVVVTTSPTTAKPTISLNTNSISSRGTIGWAVKKVPAGATLAWKPVGQPLVPVKGLVVGTNQGTTKNTYGPNNFQLCVLSSAGKTLVCSVSITVRKDPLSNKISTSPTVVPPSPATKRIEQQSLPANNQPSADWKTTGGATIDAVIKRTTTHAPGDPSATNKDYKITVKGGGLGSGYGRVAFWISQATNNYAWTALETIKNGKLVYTDNGNQGYMDNKKTVKVCVFNTNGKHIACKNVKIT